MDDLKRNIYEQLRSRYDDDPESLTDTQKAVLALLASGRLLDKLEARERLVEVLKDRCTQAEKWLNLYETKKFVGKSPIDAYFNIMPVDSAEMAGILNDPVTQLRIIELDGRFVRLVDEKEPQPEKVTYGNITQDDITKEIARLQESEWTPPEGITIEEEAAKQASLRKLWGDEKFERIQYGIDHPQEFWDIPEV